MNPLDIWKIIRGIRKLAKERFTDEGAWHRLMRFLFVHPLGMLIPWGAVLFALYHIATVWVHHMVFELILLNGPLLAASALTLYVAYRFVRRYVVAKKDWIALFSPIVVTAVLGALGLAILVFYAARGVIWVRLNEDANFQEIDVLPRISNDLVRYTPAQVAAEEIVRRTQSSEFTPGDTRPIGSSTGVAYIAPLVPQGMWNALLSHNRSFMYFEDGGRDEARERVNVLPSDPFAWGEGMEVFDDIHRRLIKRVGFFNTYPEIYYAPIYDEGGQITQVMGVAPYISYRFWWGLLIPQWGGVAIFHADGTIQDLSPQEATDDPRLAQTQSTFPKKLARDYIHSERYDHGDSLAARVWYGLIRRPGKIEIPPMPGSEQQPFFLPMEDGSYAYLATVEPDGEAYSLMRVYLVNARTGERFVYRLDREGRPGNLQGPRKIISYAKALPNYVWVEGHGSKQSGSYRIVEPRPVTPVGTDRLFWMLSITPADYARVVATVFVDAATNEVHGPFATREQTFAWLHGEEVNAGDPLSDGGRVCERIEELWANECSALRPGTALPR